MITATPIRNTTKIPSGTRSSAMRLTTVEPAKLATASAA
jgi:hypothetical protein